MEDTNLESSISEEGAKQLVNQLVRLGCFHNRNSTQQITLPADDLETFRKLQKDPPQSFSADLKCQIIPTLDGSEYYTQEGFVKALVKQLERLGGRKSQDELSRFLKVNPNYLTAVDSPIRTILPSSVQLLGSEVISDSYWKQLRQELAHQVQTRGCLQILELASQYSLPMETLFAKSISGIPQTSLIGDSKNVLVSESYLQALKSEVIATFQGLTEPTLISAVCQDHTSWDLDLVVNWLLSTTETTLGGEVHGDATSTTSAMFLPKVYSQKQHQEILDFVSANGYLTAERATRQGMSMSQAIALVKESSDAKALLLSENVFILEHVLQNVQVAIQETAGTIVDLQEYELPAELIRSDILPMLLSRAGFTNDHGVAVLVEDQQALIVSRDVIQGIHQKVLPPLIENFAKTRAEELFRAATPAALLNEEEEETPTSSKKERSKSRKAKASSRSNNNKSSSKDETSPTGVVPLLLVAGAVLKEHRAFHTDTVEQDLLDMAETIGWENDEEDSGILVLEFCKVALYTDEFRSKCDKAVQAELHRLKSEKQSKATHSRKDAAAKVRSVEASFEDAFITACYMVQALSKFIALAASSEHFEDETTIEVLRQEFLEGCCADLTSRITQYCLFKNEEDAVFAYRHPDDDDVGDDDKSKKEDSSGDLRTCCAPVDSAVRHYHRSFFSCPPPREPLPVLRESLPGNMGVTLARQWVLCGGKCYRGGVRTSEEDGTTFVRPGNMDGFISHVTENCLTLCGLPFKKLDKKSEKQFLFARRQNLTQLLQTETDPQTVLELTIMILFQQVKQIVVAGSLLRGTILMMLMDERKISEPVASALKTLNEAIVNQGDTAMINDDIVAAVKECGLCRDITKHLVQGSE